MDTLDALRLFVKVADVGSFSAVARGRALAVSTVTLAIQQLEQQLGSTLLQRTTRKVSLTEEGQVFLPTCPRRVTTMATRHGSRATSACLAW